MSEDIGRRLARLEQQVTAISRAPKLTNASLEDATLEVYDDKGSLRALVGQQPDGTSGVTVVNGPVPPMPAKPTVTSSMGTLVISWDGKFDNNAVSPLDFARVEVHVGAVPDFEPDASTLRGTVETAQGGTVTVTLGYQQWWVRLRTRSLSGATSAATAAVAGEPRQAHTTDIAAGAITADKLSIGSTGNLLPDPGFETGLTESRLADLGMSWARIESGGADSPCCLTIATTGGEPRWLPYDPFAVNPGDMYWLGIHYRCSKAWVGSGVGISLVWRDAKGKILNTSSVTAPEPKADGQWRRISGKVRAPEGAVRAEARLQAGDGTAGEVSFDNAECRSIMTSAASGERAEIGPDGVRLFDGQGEQVVSLVTGAPNYLSLSSHDGTSVASISDTGAAGFQSLSVAGKLTWQGDDLQTVLDSMPRGLVAINRQTARVETTGTEVGWVEVGFDADPTREYRIVVDAHVSPSVAGGELRLRLRDGGASAPDIRSPQVQSAMHQLVRDGGWQRVRLELPISGSVLGKGKHRLLATFDNRQGPAGQSVTLIGGQSYPGFMYIEDVGPKLKETGGYNTGGGSSSKPDPDPKPVPQQYTTTYAAAWSGSYSRRSSYNSYYGAQMLQGYYSENNGTQASLCGFPADMVKDLSTASVQKVELFLYFDHWYSSSGGKAVIKPHGHTSRPATFSCGSSSKSVDWSRNEGKWVDVTALFEASTTRGFALDPNNTSGTYYGRANGVGGANPPKLRVTYTK
ncbi:hypothetical protein ACFY1P_29535 [Streptomyces sp. NPDC001407]|uniref:hypothetical protein n=1 Tax=unclassified Streptomyces TaxID=2593676 RepID=UPI0036A6F925